MADFSGVLYSHNCLIFFFVLGGPGCIEYPLVLLFHLCHLSPAHQWFLSHRCGSMFSTSRGQVSLGNVHCFEGSVGLSRARKLPVEMEVFSLQSVTSCA